MSSKSSKEKTIERLAATLAATPQARRARAAAQAEIAQAQAARAQAESLLSTAARLQAEAQARAQAEAARAAQAEADRIAAEQRRARAQAEATAARRAARKQRPNSKTERAARAVQIGPKRARAQAEARAILGDAIVDTIAQAQAQAAQAQAEAAQARAQAEAEAERLQAEAQAEAKAKAEARAQARARANRTRRGAVTTTDPAIDLGDGRGARAVLKQDLPPIKRAPEADRRLGAFDLDQEWFARAGDRNKPGAARPDSDKNRGSRAVDPGAFAQSIRRQETPSTKLSIRDRIAAGLPLNSKQRRLMRHILQSPAVAAPVPGRNPYAQEQLRRAQAEAAQAAQAEAAGYRVTAYRWPDCVLYCDGAAPLAILWAPETARPVTVWRRALPWFPGSRPTTDAATAAQAVAMLTAIHGGAAPTEETARLMKPDAEKRAQARALQLQETRARNKAIRAAQAQAVAQAEAQAEANHAQAEATGAAWARRHGVADQDLVGRRDAAQARAREHTRQTESDHAAIRAITAARRGRNPGAELVAWKAWARANRFRIDAVLWARAQAEAGRKLTVSQAVTETRAQAEAAIEAGLYKPAGRAPKA